jgi:hypothetical protein
MHHWEVKEVDIRWSGRREQDAKFAPCRGHLVQLEQDWCKNDVINCAACYLDRPL